MRKDGGDVRGGSDGGFTGYNAVEQSCFDAVSCLMGKKTRGEKALIADRWTGGR